MWELEFSWMEREYVLCDVDDTNEVVDSVVMN